LCWGEKIIFMKKFIFIFLAVLIISCNSSKIDISNSSKYYTDSIYSNSLQEYRLHNIYLPKNFSKKNQYPILYATDGNKMDVNNTTKILLDSLIENKLTPPFIVIESHQNSKIADSTSTTNGYGMKIYNRYRYFDYVPNQTLDPILKKRFNNHMNYFVSELIPKIEIQFNQKNTKENRFFYGVSNGGSFGINMLNSNPNIIGTYICYSTIGGDIQSMNWDKKINYPKLYLQYGNQEPVFLKNDADYLIKKYTELNLFCEINSFDGGHDNVIWKEKFISTIKKTIK
jgi:enterochelin esterase-like enzyme